MCLLPFEKTRTAISAHEKCSGQAKKIRRPAAFATSDSDAIRLQVIPLRQSAPELPLAVAAELRTDNLSRGRIQEQEVAHAAVVEVEHSVDRARDCVKRTAADALALEPVVLDEANDRALVEDGVVIVVLLGV